MEHVKLQNLRFETIVGILDWERTTPQPIVLDVTLEQDLVECGRTGNLKLGVDYAAVMDELMFLTKAGQFELLESLCVAACSLLLYPPHRSAPRRVSIAASKPTVLKPFATPCITMRADSAQLSAPAMKQRTQGVQAATILRTEHALVERLRLDQGAKWSAPRPCYAYRLGHGLSEEARKRPVLRRVTEVTAGDTASDWIVVTR